MKHFLTTLASAVFVLVFTLGCQQQRDRNGILSERAMVDVLYDYQMAMALAAEETEQGKLAETEYRYTQAVLRKHMLTDQEFQLSIAHYARDPKMMLDITKRVTKRFEEQTDFAATGADGDSFTYSADTVLLYRNMGSILLTANGHNRASIEVPVSQKVKADRIFVSFISRWLSQEPVKNGSVIITTQFDNDSTARRAEAIREYNRTQGISVPVPDGRHVKTITVDFLQSGRWSKLEQVLSLDDVALRAIVAKNK